MRCIVNGTFISYLQKFGNGPVVPFVVMTGSKKSDTFAFVMDRIICEIEAVLHSWRQPPQLAPLLRVPA